MKYLYTVVLAAIIVGACSPTEPIDTSEKSASHHGSEAAMIEASPSCTRPPPSSLELLRANCDLADAEKAKNCTEEMRLRLINWANDIHECDPRTDAAMELLSRPEIIGGAKIPEFAYPETVMLTPTNEADSPLCTGVLIHPKVVVTAAHCVTDPQGIAVLEGSTIRFGRHWNSPAIVRRVTNVEVASLSLASSDIALVWMNEPVPSTFLPATIANEIDVQAAEIATSIATIANGEDATNAVAARVVGYGLTENMEWGEKLYADVAVVTANCDSGFFDRHSGTKYTDAKFYDCDAGSELVAGSVTPGKHPSFSQDTCSGDSGGPLFVVPSMHARTSSGYYGNIGQSEASDPINYRLAAITSRAIESDYVKNGWQGCGNGGIYERISGDNLRWIRCTMLKKKTPLANFDNSDLECNDF